MDDERIKPCPECGGDGGHHDFGGRWERCVICAGSGDSGECADGEASETVREPTSGMVMAGARAMVMLGREKGTLPSRTEEARACLKAALSHPPAEGKAK